MIEIDITDFVREAEPFDFSGSVAERGPNAAAKTWANANAEAAARPLLSPEQVEALRKHMREMGAWTDEEIAGWSETECNAFFIQLISGDMREAGLDQGDFDDIDWLTYEKGCHEGRYGGSLYRGDDGRVYYHLGI